MNQRTDERPCDDQEPRSEPSRRSEYEAPALTRLGDFTTLTRINLNPGADLGALS